MALIFITGLPGTGKSTVCAELTKRGFNAVDADEGNVSQWYDISTGKAVTQEFVYALPADEWFGKYDLRLSEKRVKKLAHDATGKVAFLSGAKLNGEEMAGLFDMIINLSVDTETLKYRLASRTSNSFGKQSNQLKFILEQHKISEAKPKSEKVVNIDATQPLTDVVDSILAHVANAG
jgi:dephospho-CoA kinase